MKASLGKKLGLAFAILILIYGLLLGSSVYYFVKGYASENIMRDNRQTVRNVQDYYLKNLLTDMSKVVTYWSVYPELIHQGAAADSSETGYAQMHSEWKSYLTLNRDVSCIYFGSDADGGLSSVPERMTLPRNYDARHRTWYEGARSNPDRVFWSRPYMDVSSNGDMILTVSKVVKQGDTILGVVGMDIKLRLFSRMLTGVYANQSGYIVVLDSKGVVYAHPNEELLATDMAGEGWAQDALKNKEGQGSFSQSGHRYAYAFVTLPETGWKLVGIREIDLAALFDNLKAMTLVTAIMVAAVLMLAAILSARFILKPLQAIMETIRSVSRGEMDARSVRRDGAVSRDEIGEISEAFDRMLDRIHEMHAERDQNLKMLTEQNLEIRNQKQEIHTLYEISDSVNQELEESILRIQSGYLATVRSLANAIEADDHYTRGHCQRVNDYSLKLGRLSGFNSSEMKDLEFAGILHDIGKIGIPDGIINKPGRLTEEEFERVKQHPAIGAEILEGVTFLESCRMILLQHHERIDGKGYPVGLKGEAIHPAAKVLAIADSFDAMTSNRPYRSSALSVAEAIKELEKGRGTQFDPLLTDRFIHLIRNSEFREDSAETPSAIETSAV